MLHVKGSNPTTGAITDAGGPKDYTDWKSIFTAAADVDYYHWEYDLSPDPFASAKIAFKLLDCATFGKVRDESGGVGGTVPATLALTLGTRRLASARSSRAWRRSTRPRRPPT